MKKFILGVLLGNFITTASPSIGSAASNISFTWSATNPSVMTGSTILKGTSTGIHGGVSVPRFCVLFNGSSKYVGASVFRAGEGWYASWAWKEEQADTCFVYEGRYQSAEAVSSIEFGVFLPQNLPAGQLEIKIQMFDNVGVATLSGPLSIQNNAQQPEFKVTGIQGGNGFTQDGESVKVEATISKLYTWGSFPNETTDSKDIASWCFGLSENQCLPEPYTACGTLCKSVVLDTRKIPNGLQNLHISIVDRYGRTLRNPAISFSVKKSPPIVLAISNGSGNATWKDKNVSHTVSINTRMSALSIEQSLNYGLSKNGLSHMGRVLNVNENLLSETGDNYKSTKFLLVNLKPATTYWVKVKLINSEGSTIKVLRIKSRTIPEKPAPSSGSGSGSGGSFSPGGCYVGMNWQSCINTLGYEPKFYDCSGSDRWSIINSNWWIIRTISGIPVISKSPAGCR